MKRCPKCNRSYTTDTQKFCTHDGGILETVNAGPETIRLDSSELDLDDDEPTKAISRELPAPPAEFDPFKTVMSRPEATTLVGVPETQGLSSPAATLPPPRAASVPPPAAAAAPPPPPVSTPPPPPPPPQLPTQRLVGSASLPPPALAQPTAQPTVTAPVKKKSKLPLVLGILLVLLVLGAGGLGAAYFFVLRPMLAARKDVIVEPSHPPTKEPTPNVETTPNEVGKKNTSVVPEPPAYSPPADAVEFVNSSKSLDGQLAEHYVDFSFYYPNRWQKDPTAGVPGARNFAQVERRLPPDFTQENFAVAWNSSAAPVAENLALFQTLARNLSAQLAKKFPGYRKVSEGETKAGVYDGYEFRFEGSSLNTAKGDLKLWGRVIFLPPQDGGKDGVTLLMLATSLAPELKTLDDVGVKGDLPMMLKSFRFGKK